MLRNFKTLVTLFILNISFVFAQEKGRVAGKIEDAGTSEELIGVAVGVKGSSFGATTDIEGRYILSLESGIYTLVFSYIGYKTQEITGVEIKAGTTVTLSMALEEAIQATEEVVVTAKMESASTNALLIEQKNSVSVSSGISAELIKKTPDRTTADVMKRVSGASIQDGKYAIIRGLNERYNTAMINGTLLPSTESDRKAFSFDLIPSGLIDKLTINKSFTADMPGDVAGGLIQITTRDIPDENKQSIQVGIGSNSITTSQPFYKGALGKYDFLGFDDGSRSIPKDVGTTEENLAMKSNPVAYDQLATEQAKNSWTHHFTPTLVPKVRPNLNFQYSLARRMKVLGNDLGLIFALTYNNNNRYDPGVNNVVNLGNEDQGGYYGARFYRNQVLGGSILNLSYKIGENTKFSLKNLFNINSESYTMLRNADITPGEIQNASHRKEYAFYFHSNKMISSQFGGEHFLPSSKVKVNYTLGFNNIDRQIPDYRRISYESSSSAVTKYDPDKDQDVIVGYVSSPLSSIYTKSQGNFIASTGAGRFFSTLNEKSLSASYDFKIPVILPWPFKNELKLGGFHQYRFRDFRSRTFVYRYNGTLFQPIKNFEGEPETIFTPDNFSYSTDPNKAGGLRLDEDNLYTWYKGSSRLNAVYGMGESKLNSFLRAVYGIRVEQFYQVVTSYDQTIGIVKPVIDNVDYLPSGTLIGSINEKMSVKASYSKTLNRPEFREASPTQFFDFYTQSLVQGNPDLKRATIKNYDMRWEYYPTAAEVLSINPFYKDFSDPIENVSNNSSQGVRTFSKTNQSSAYSYGLELESRLNMSRLGNLLGVRFLKRLTIYGNYTYIRSKVKLDLNSDANLDQQLKDKGRPLQGQSPYIINAGLLYNDDEHALSVALSVNRTGDRIYMVNQIYNQIMWEAARTVLDFKITKTVYKRFETSITLGDLLAGGLKIGGLIKLPSQPLVFYNDVDGNGKFNSDKDIVQIGYGMQGNSPLSGVSMNLGYTATFSIAYNFK